MAGSPYSTTAANWGLVFYGPDPTVALDITAGASSYTITDIHGATVSSGSIGSTETSFNPTAPSPGGWINGWYLVRLSGPSSYFAISTFQIINSDSHFKTVPAWGSPVNAADPTFVGDDHVGLLTSQMGAYRDGTTISNPASPSVGINAMQANLAFWEDWITSDSVRQPVYICPFPNGSTDSVKIGNVTFYRRGTQTDPASITIGAGTQSGTYKLTVTDTNTSTTVETHNNCYYETDIQAAVNANDDGWLYAWGAQQNTAPTEATATLDNANTLGTIQAVQSLYNYNSIGITWFEGPENEPSGGDPGGSAAFTSIVHAAKAEAKALVPSLLGAGNGGMSKWVDAMQEIGVTPDGVSFHGYNLFDSADLDAEDQTIPGVVDAVHNAWGTSMPIFQTEFGWISTVGYQLFSPYLAARQMIGILAYAEMAGIPKEKFVYFYCCSHGFGGYPSWWKNADGTLMPHWIAARNVSERLYGTTFAERINLPSPLDRMFLAAKWTDATNQTILIQPTGMPTAVAKLTVSGTTSLTVYDWAGNNSAVDVTGETATVNLSGLGTWIVAPAAATITIDDLNDGLMKLGLNQADHRINNVAVTTSSTVTADQTGDPGHPGVVWLNGVDPMTADRTSMGQQPWKDSSDALPSYLTFTFDNPTRVDRALVFCPPPITEGQRNSLTQLEVQYQAPGESSWTTAYSEANSTAYSDALVGDWSNAIGSGVHVTQLSHWDQKYHFDCVFTTGPVMAQAVRVIAQAASFGDSPDSASNSGGVGANLTAYFECRLVGLYCVAAQTNPSVLV